MMAASSLTLLSRRFYPVVIRFAAQPNCNKFSLNRSFTIPTKNLTIRCISSITRRHPIQSSLIYSPKGSNNSPELLGTSKSALNLIKGFPKSFSFRKKHNSKDEKKRVPKLILMQNPFTWLMIKIDFRVLRNIWDPTFQEKEFKYGTKQAISRITHVISQGQYSELNGLLTKAARLSLMRELDRNWSDKQRSLLALKHDDIQISSPRKVYFIRLAEKKFCDVDMAFLALKWIPINSIDALIFTEIFARFHREYTPHSIPEWTIAYFKVTRFEVLRKSNKNFG